MKKIFLLLTFFFLVTVAAQAQFSRYIIQLKDKKGTAGSIANPSTYLSPKAIARRTKYAIPIDSTDLPIVAAYIDSIQSVPNVVVLNKSKWLNQICIRTTDTAAITKINSFSFVKITGPIAARMANVAPVSSNKFDDIIPTPITTRVNEINSPADINGIQNYYNYGSNFGQIHIHEGEYLHNLGFHGEGITITFLDAGFQNYLFNPAFDSILQQNQVLGTWDYVNSEASVVEDHPHGAWCLSTIAANEPGIMVGTAPKAHFWLFRTEDANSEYPVEEQNWVAGAEFADSAGTDMISSSLGYSSFDAAVFNHSYAQRDGKTSMISIGANLAVKKGILVTNSAGNSGNSPTDKYVLCPADAEAVLTIGATDINGKIAGFSSWGPNGAGLQKPNIVSVGAPAVVAATSTGAPVNASGTSLSNPNICGLIACLWQAFPEFSNLEIIDAVQKSSSKYTSPDNQYGYGIPNMRIAYQNLLQQRIINNSLQVLGKQWIKAYPVPFTDNLNILLKAPLTGQCSVRLIDMNGKTIEIKSTSIQQDNLYTISFSKAMAISKGVYNVQYVDGRNKVTLRVVKQ